MGSGAAWAFDWRARPLQITISGGSTSGGGLSQFCPEICSGTELRRSWARPSPRPFRVQDGARFLFLPGRPGRRACEAMNATWPAQASPCGIEPAGQSFVARIGEPSGVSRRVFRSAAVSTAGSNRRLTPLGSPFEMRFRAIGEIADGDVRKSSSVCRHRGDP